MTKLRHNSKVSAKGLKVDVKTKRPKRQTRQPDPKESVKSDCTIEAGHIGLKSPAKAASELNKEAFQQAQISEEVRDKEPQSEESDDAD